MIGAIYLILVVMFYINVWNHSVEGMLVAVGGLCLVRLLNE